MIVLVLRNGGPDYGPDDVGKLVEQIRRHSETEIVCLADCDVPCERIPLRHNWPGWWSKMELYRPDLRGNFVYMDLDTIVRGPIDGLFTVKGPALLRDFYRHEGLGSGLMALPEECRAEIWQAWIASPEKWMAEHHIDGDQAFLERFWLQTANRLQDHFPGIASYKASTREEVQAASVVCFHGQPKPRDVRWTV